MAYAVEISNLSKKYKKQQALEDLNFKLEENKIYGLLGRNGAGKTTLLNIITARILQTGGKVCVLGEEPYENQKILSKICYVKDTMYFMSSFKIKAIFSIAADFFENWDEAFKDRLVESFGLDVKKGYKTLSKGMEAMVGIIIGLASRAPLTIFDEAYLGLDAAARQLFYDILLEDYMENPRTIIFSTHLIDEVSNIFEDIIILNKGKLLLQEKADSIKNKAFQVYGSEELLKEVLKNKNILTSQQLGKSQKVFLYDDFCYEELQELQGRGIEVKAMSLQDLFIQITDK